MTRPSSDNIRVSLQELAKESETWSQIANHLGNANYKITNGTDLSAVEMGVFFPGYWAYTGARDKLLALTEAGETEAKSISTTLDGVRRKYEEEEQVNAETGQSIHEQLEQW